MELKKNELITEPTKEINSVGQCGEKCPQNSSDHRGECYLDFGHTESHKCSVDGHEW